jgi:ADP-heptose:LPS heptosyltransferase
MLSFLNCFDFIDGTIRYEHGFFSMVKMATTIRRLEIDTIINFERAFKKSLIAFISGAKRRIGFDSFELAPFLTDRAEDLKGNKEAHMRQRYFCLTKFLGMENYEIVLPFTQTIEANKKVEKFLFDLDIKDTDFIVGINPTTGFPAKYWDNKRWAHIADYLIQNKKARVIITFGPSPGQLETARDIQNNMKEEAILSFNTSLIEFGALIKRFKLFICLDSGPLHFAVSQNIPTISLWGRGNLNQWGPPPDQHVTIFKNAPCSPCNFFVCDHRTCMKEIKEKDVIEKIDEWSQDKNYENMY